MSSKTILFVGGGTAGHTAPLLAVMAQVAIQEPTTKMVYLGLESDLQSALIKESNLKFDKYAIQAGKINRFLTLKHFKEIFRFWQGIWQAREIITKIKPDLIFAKGGFVSVPVVMAAARKNIPIYCHESDVIAGLANRYVAKKAQVIFTSYPTKFYQNLPSAKLIFSGQPVRSGFWKIPPSKISLLDRELDPHLPIITVIGGSQGAQRLNEISQSLWTNLLGPVQIVNICGAYDLDRMRLESERLTQNQLDKLWLVDFLQDEIFYLFLKSAVIVSRAGGTIAELAAAKACTVLVPLSTSAQGHQQANAQVLEKAGAAIVINETLDNASDLLLQEVEELLQNQPKNNQFRERIAAFSKNDAAQVIAEKILK